MAHPDRGFDVCLVTPEGVETPGAEGLRVMRARGENPFAGSVLREARRAHVAYLRVLLPSLLGRDYARVLYLDADIHLERGDLGHLLGVDLHGEAVGAVRDHKQWRTPGHKPAEFVRLGWSNARYLNSGVLLLDTVRFEAEGLTEPYGRGRHASPPRGGTHPLRPFGHQRGPARPLDRAVPRSELAAQPRVALRHGAWRSRVSSTSSAGGSPGSARRATCRRASVRAHAFLAEHAPGHPALAGLDPTARAEPRDLGKSYFTHWRRWRAMQSYLARFSSDTTTHPPERAG